MVSRYVKWPKYSGYIRVDGHKVTIMADKDFIERDALKAEFLKLRS